MEVIESHVRLKLSASAGMISLTNSFACDPVRYPDLDSRCNNLKDDVKTPKDPVSQSRITMS